MDNMQKTVNPEKALIFRTTHVDNLPWILEHDGLYCENGGHRSPDFDHIGNPQLISKRRNRRIEAAPGKTLGDFIPFYLTPSSIMMFNIKTGVGGVAKRMNKDLIIFVSSLDLLGRNQIPFFFTNGHAYSFASEYYENLEDLDKIDWQLLQSRDFKHDPDDPGKKERYQAEALAYQHVPLAAMHGMACVDQEVARKIELVIEAHQKILPVKIRPEWYF